MRHPNAVEDAIYLTLLSSFRMLQIVINEVPAMSAGNLSIQPPNTIDEKDLYGC